MAITKQRSGGGRRNRRGGRRSGGRRRSGLRTEAEQLDYEMELLKAQREGREEEFKAEERAKLRAKKAQELDAEMDDYFKQKDDATDEKDGKGEAQESQSNGDKSVPQNGQAEQAPEATAN